MSHRWSCSNPWCNTTRTWAAARAARSCWDGGPKWNFEMDNHVLNPGLGNHGARHPMAERIIQKESPGWLLPTVLSTTAGAVDVIGFLALGGLFTAHITGNLVVLLAHYITGNFGEIGPLLAVPIFIVVLGVVTLTFIRKPTSIRSEEHTSELQSHVNLV